jgi:hypothetical protein
LAKAFDRPGLSLRSLLLPLPALAALALGAAGCVPFRETRQTAACITVLDASTRKPIPGAVLLIEADRGKRGVTERRRYATDAEGRVSAPRVRGWTFVMGIPLPGDVVGEWRNEHLYLAPGHAWLRVPLGEDLEGRAPDQVLLDRLPRGAPRLDLDKAAGRAWSGLETWEIAVPGCEGFAQGLREGDGRVIYWDPRHVVLAATVEAAGGGLRFEDSPRRPGVVVITAPRARKVREAVLDARACTLQVSE